MQTHEMADRLAEEIPCLSRFALSLARDQQRAQDLVQDTLERAIIKAHLFDGVNLRSWLLTICRRIFLNNVRQTRMRGEAVDLDAAPTDAVSVPQEQDAKMRYLSVVKHFQALPLRDKVIISLIVFDGLKYEEVAKTLSVPVGTVRSRLSRARRRLLEQIGEDGKRRAAHPLRGDSGEIDAAA